MKRKIIFLLVALFATVVPFSYVMADSTNKEDNILPGLKEYLGDNYEERIKKNTESSKSIEAIESMFKINMFSNSTDVEIINYPDYIGGLYIDSQDDSMVIQIVKKNIPSAKREAEYELYNSALSIAKDAKIEYVDYSYNEINRVIQILDDYYSKNYETGYIEGYYDDITNNRIVVELKQYSEDNINYIKNNIIDSPLITFVQSNEKTDYLTTYTMGTGIVPMGCSIGFRAKSNNIKGFVTAGHCVTQGVGQAVPLYGTVKKHKNSGNMDAAWIQTETTVSVENRLRYIPSLNYGYTVNNTPVTSFSVGQLYGKSAAMSQYTYGNITNTSVAMNGITGLIGTSVYAKEGDSGGIVFKISGGTGTTPTGYQTAGIVKGGPQGGGNMAFVKANNIVSSLGLTTY